MSKAWVVLLPSPVLPMDAVSITSPTSYSNLLKERLYEAHYPPSQSPAKTTKEAITTLPDVTGLTGKLSWQSHQRVKQRSQSRNPRRKKPLGVETAHFKRVAMLPCACCGIVGFSQAAHSNRYQDGKAARIKAHYLATFPLCCSRPGIRGCHVEHDQCIGMTRKEADARTTAYIADTHRRLEIHQ